MTTAPSQARPDEQDSAFLAEARSRIGTAGQPQVAERFDLFVRGMELANAYTELNDPLLQERLFQTQLAGQKAEDSMATMDTDFVRALKHAMPPAGGLGIGLDRLCMLLLNRANIRDVILFPPLRPEA